MTTPFECPHCGAVTQVADQFIGQTGPCASCGQAVTVARPQKPGAVPTPSKVAGGMSGLVIVLIVVLGIMVCGGGGLVALLLPAVQSARGAAERMQCSNNMKQIALALHNYHDSYGALPPAYTVDADGNKLHSWRTLILPFLEQSALYSQIDFSTAWDSPQNVHLSEMVLPVFCCPSEDGTDPTQTSYLAIVGPGAIFEGANPIAFKDIKDGLSNTLLLVEVADSSVNWMEPTDLDLESMAIAINGGAGEMGSRHRGGMQVAMADGSVRFLSETVDKNLLRTLITRSDGQIVPSF